MRPFPDEFKIREVKTSLIFRNLGGLEKSRVFFPVGAGYVPKGSVVHGRCQFRQWNLTFGVADRTAAEQAGLRRHGVLGGVLGTIVRHVNWLRIVALNRSGLSEGSGRGTQKKKSKDCSLHRIDPVWGKLRCLKELRK